MNTGSTRTSRTLLKAVGLVSMLGLLAACESTGSGSGSVTGSAPEVVVIDDPISARLADAAEKAAAALEVLSMVEQARVPGEITPMVIDAPSELRQPVTMTWIGPVEQVSEMLAEVAGYTFSVMGYPPSEPLIVTLDVSEKPVIDVLRDIGLQMGEGAEMAVNAQGRIVEVRYGSAEDRP